MADNEFETLFEGLNEEEAKALAHRITAAARRERDAMQAEKHQAKNTELESQYRAELGKIAQTYRGDTKIRMITDLKAKYRGMGLGVN